MKIAVFSTQQYDRDFLTRFNTGHELTFFEIQLDKQTAELTAGFDAVCIFVNDKMGQETIQILKENSIKLIVLRCAGYNNVAVEAAQRAGIAIVRVPAYSPESVAEHAIALMLTLNRKTHKAYNRIREGNFSLERLLGFNLYKKQVAIIGTGNIGKALCRILVGFGCEIKAYDLFPDAEMEKLGVKYDTLQNVISNADIISLHCPLTDESKHMINKETLELVKKGAMLINTSRGGLIHTQDVIQAMKHGTLGYLGLDVYEQEDQLFFHDLSEDIILDDLIARLISFPNVLITSHQGFFTKEAMEEIAKVSFDNIDAFAEHMPLKNLVKR
ncbi:MAG: 2-hydroxyacid dehydrogenase [Sphingobacteriaceae bacterium]